MWYEACDSIAGEPLRRVLVVRDPDLSSEVICVQLDFGRGSVFAVVVPEDDTVRIAGSVAEDMTASLRDESDRAPWARLIGRKLGWSWLFTNQQGYEDGVQFEFPAGDGSSAVRVQMIAIASRFDVQAFQAV